jgi:hypothetical protein
MYVDEIQMFSINWTLRAIGRQKLDIDIENYDRRTKKEL